MSDNNEVDLRDVVMKLSIERRVELIEKAIKDSQVAFHGVYHDTINTRIKNICNVLGMDLNGTESPKIKEITGKFKHQCENCQILMQDRVKEIKELKENQNHWATLENVTVCRLGIENLEEILQELLPLFTWTAPEKYKIERINKLLAKLDGEKAVGSVLDMRSDNVVEGLSPLPITDSKPPSNYTGTVPGLKRIEKEIHEQDDKLRHFGVVCEPCTEEWKKRSEKSPNKCDICGSEAQVYCVKCMENSVHKDFRESAKILSQDDLVELFKRFHSQGFEAGQYFEQSKHRKNEIQSKEGS